MLRSRLTRIFFLTLLLMFAFFWAASYFRSFHVQPKNSSRVLRLWTDSGAVCISWGNTMWGVEWDIGLAPLSDAPNLSFAAAGGNFLGFGFGQVYRPLPSIPPVVAFNFIRFPLWFPTLLSALLLLLAWRKTTRPNPSRAFPIEPSTPTPITNEKLKIKTSLRGPS